MNSKVLIILMIILPLPLMWKLLEPYTQEVDLFLFIDFEQELKWYVHYSAFYIENIVKSAVIYILISNDKLKKIAFAFVLLSVYRMLEYYFFRFTIPYLPICGIILAYTIYIYEIKPKK